jgi:hypothetical protein
MQVTSQTTVATPIEVVWDTLSEKTQNRPIS